MKRIISLLIVVVFHATQIFSQTSETTYPSVSYSNCDYCKIVKVIVSHNETRVCIEVTAQPKKKVSISFSSLTVLVPNSDIDISDLRKYYLDLEKVEQGKAYDPLYQIGRAHV